MNQLITSLLGDTADRWRAEGIGWGERGCYSMFWWADNMFLLARSVAEAEKMFAEVDEKIRKMAGMIPNVLW